MDRTPCQEWLEAQIKGNDPPTANALAIRWGYPSSYLARWRWGGVPEFYRIPELAAKSGTPLDEMQRIIYASKQMKSASKRTVIDRRLYVTKPPQMVRSGRLYREFHPGTQVAAVAGS